MKFEKEIGFLRRMIEQSVGRKMSSPADFQLLKDEILNRIGANISLSTLKRVWRYVNVSTNPTTYTLSTLSKFVGFRNWNHFLENYCKDQASSQRLATPCFSLLDCGPGKYLHLRWAPDRHCVFKHIGEHHFLVTLSENSKLHIGDTFRLTDVIVGEPLYLYDFVHADQAPSIFVIGQSGGISDVKIENE